MTKDRVKYDELDGFDHDIDKEGSPTSLGDTRIKTSTFPKSIRGSTPREKSTSLIEQSLREADKVFARHLPCPHCDHEQFLKWSNITFENKDPETTKYVCEKNGCVIDYSDYPEMDKKGRWKDVTLKKDGTFVDGNGDYYDEGLDLFFNAEGEIVVDPRHIGVVLWGAYSYHQTWADGVYEFLAARAEQKKGNLTKMKTWINIYLGESYEEKGERVEQEWGGRLEDYSVVDAIPNDILIITIGADVQSGKNARIECEIVGYGLGEESWGLDYLVIPGNPIHDEVWDHLDETLLKTFTREDGVVLKVAGMVVDSGHLQGRVFQYTGPRLRRQVYASKGKAQHTGPIAGKPTWQGDKKTGRALQIPVNTDEAKETIYTRLEEVEEHGPGYMHFPAHYDDEYFNGLTAEEKKTRYVRGVPKREWVPIPNRRNEPLDCRVASLVSLRRINPNLKRLKMRLDALADSISRNVVPNGRTSRRVRSAGIR